MKRKPPKKEFLKCSCFFPRSLKLFLLSPRGRSRLNFECAELRAPFGIAVDNFRLFYTYLQTQLFRITMVVFRRRIFAMSRLPTSSRFTKILFTFRNVILKQLRTTSPTESILLSWKRTRKSLYEPPPPLHHPTWPFPSLLFASEVTVEVVSESIK